MTTQTYQLEAWPVLRFAIETLGSLHPNTELVVPQTGGDVRMGANLYMWIDTKSRACFPFQPGGALAQ